MSNNSSISPLSEANVASLDEYFSRKPPYDAETLARIKQEFRRRRELMQQAAAEGAKAPRARKASNVASETSVDLFAPEAVPSKGGTQ